MQTRAVVIGGGIAGLVAAADLARAGAAPVLLEAAPQLGGRARTVVRDGYAFNQGPHALYVAGALGAVLAEFGVAAKGGQLDVSKGLALWGGAARPWPIGGAAPPLDAEDSAALAAQLRRIARGDYDGRGQPLSAITAALPTHARAVVEALARVSTYSHAPDLLDAKAALDQMRLSFAGVLYLDGGWGRLVDALAQVARAAGATLRTEARVAAITPRDGGWRADLVGEDPILCEAVILAVPPAEAAALAPSSTSLRAAQEGLVPARIMGLDLGLLPGVRSRADFALGMDAPLYVSVHSTVAKLAPEGAVLAHLARYMAPDEAASPAAITELETLADSLFPGWRSHEQHRQRQVAMIVAHDLPQARTGGRRTPSRVADSLGLYLAGDWIGDEGMLVDAAAASARTAAAGVLSELGEPIAGRTSPAETESS